MRRACRQRGAAGGGGWWRAGAGASTPHGERNHGLAGTRDGCREPPLGLPPHPPHAQGARTGGCLPRRRHPPARTRATRGGALVVDRVRAAGALGMQQRWRGGPSPAGDGRPLCIRQSPPSLQVMSARATPHRRSRGCSHRHAPAAHALPWMSLFATRLTREHTPRCLGPTRLDPLLRWAKQSGEGTTAVVRRDVTAVLLPTFRQGALWRPRCYPPAPASTERHDTRRPVPARPPAARGVPTSGTIFSLSRRPVPPASAAPRPCPPPPRHAARRHPQRAAPPYPPGRARCRSAPAAPPPPRRAPLPPPPTSSSPASACRRAPLRRQFVGAQRPERACGAPRQPPSASARVSVVRVRTPQRL